MQLISKTLKEGHVGLADKIPYSGNRVLVIGDRGREHALAIACAASPMVDRVFVAPGNPGIHDEAKCIILPEIGIRDREAIVKFATDERITLVIPGTENSIATGIVNLMESAGIPTFAPRFGDAWLELSKTQMKRFAERHGIPTAPFKTFETLDPAAAFIQERWHHRTFPLVVKADGLRDGKGVEVCTTLDQAIAAAQRELGYGPIVIEDKLEGQEILWTTLIGPGGVVQLPDAQDHKTVNDDGTGAMTGGVLTFSPAPRFTQPMRDAILWQIVRPALGALMSTYQGVLSFGVMYTAEGPKLLEFGIRFGCPEAEAILSRFQGDFFQVIVSVMRGHPIAVQDWKWSDQHSAVIAICNKGYPGPYKKGGIITGIERANARKGVKVYHSGTARTASGELIAVGGRLVHVRALGTDPKQALAAALRAANDISVSTGSWHRTGAPTVTDRPKKAVPTT